MKFHHWCPFILTLCFASHLAHAAAPLTLQACYDLALRRSTAVEISESEIVASAARYAQALGTALPHIAFRATEFLQDSGASGASLSNSFARTSRPELAFTATQALFQGMKEFQSLRIAKADAARVKLLTEDARRQLFADVATAFFTVARIEQDLRTIAQLLRVVRSREAVLVTQVGLGKSRESERLAQSTDRALLAAEYERQLGAKKIAYEMLAFLTGKNPHPPITWEHRRRAGVGRVQEYLGHAEQRPDVQAAQHAVAVAKGFINVQRGDLWPRADLGANYYPYRVGFQQDIHWDLQLQLSVPVFHWGTIGQVREARAQWQQAIYQAENRSRTARTEIERAYQSLQTTQRTLSEYDRAAHMAEQSYAAQESDFQLGVVTNLQVLQSQRSMLDALRLRNGAQVQAWLDWTALQVTAGLLP